MLLLDAMSPDAFLAASAAMTSLMTSSDTPGLSLTVSSDSCTEADICMHDVTASVVRDGLYWSFLSACL